MSSVNRATIAVAPTQTAAAMLKRHHPKPPLRAVTNGVDTDFYTPGRANPAVLKKFGLRSAAPKIICVGRLDGEKRVDLIIEALPEILAALPGAQLILVGRGTVRNALEAQTTRLGLSDHVVFTGLVTNEEKRDLLRAADVFVTASPSELQCISGLEALSCALPVVVANAAALVELCTDGQDGYRFTYPQAGDLAAKTLAILQDKAMRARFAAFARQWVVTYHALSVSVREYLAVYQAAVARFHRKPGA